MNSLWFLALCSLISSVTSWRTIRLWHDFSRTESINNETTLKSTQQLTFQQILDHSVGSASGTFAQRYYVDLTYYKPGGPAFLLVGGEGPLDGLYSGAWRVNAQRYGAAMFGLEHRFYGRSVPGEDLSVNNLRYLSSSQAISDIAYFISAMNSQMGQNTKWILFGGSYAGSLTAWARLKFPKLIHGAVASSAPLLAKLNFDEYYKIVMQSLSTYSYECSQAVQDGLTQIQQLLKTPNGQQIIAQMFSLCSHLQSANDIFNFMESIIGVFYVGVQYNKHEKISIRTICQVMTNPLAGSTVQRIADIAPHAGCDMRYSQQVKSIRNAQFIPFTANSRLWIYQTCNEFGFFQTSPYVSVDYFLSLCADVFGPQFNLSFIQDNIQRTNRIYGGLDIQTSNVVFVHGSIDPWHALGLTQTRTETPVIYIEGTAHCADMYDSYSSDPPQLTEARRKISHYIGTWLNH